MADQNLQVLNNSGTGDLKVPGWGIKIDYEPLDQLGYPSHQNRFRHGTNDFLGDRLTVREIAMLRFMDAITDKPDWNLKVFDDAIIGKWREEAFALSDKLMSEKAFEWCITELRDRAVAFERDGFVRTYETASRCVKSDSTIPNGLREELRRAVEPLLNIEESNKDWHPNSNIQVLNLVHPSLFPLVYGKSLVLPTGQVGLLDCLASSGKGQVIPGDQEIALSRRGHWLKYLNINSGLWSSHFQWLPSEVKFLGESGTNVKITSYINNLYPAEHHSLYNIIEKFINKAVPLWNEVLIKENGRAGPRIRTYGVQVDPPGPPEFFMDKNINIEKVKEYFSLPDNPENPEKDLLPENWENDSSWVKYEAAQWKWKRIRKIIHPEPGVSFNYEQWKKGDTGAGFVNSARHTVRGPSLDSYVVKLEEEFRVQGLQVIVKLSSIELNPDNPSYPGGNWHLEGMLNEHIVATAIYYYDVENVSESRLRIRQEVMLDDMVMSYEQDDHQPISSVFGTKSLSREPAIQEIGSIATPENRFLIFPNTLQHKVEPFELIDPSKPGHRRFLVLWLVDPHYRIMSTANVPPQQQEWVEKISATESDIERLPQELTDMVMGHATAGTMTLEEAKELRLELMKERTVFADTVERNFETYNFCEH